MRSSSHSREDTPRECATAILGGGAAGLAVAYHLGTLGRPAHVLEAESTVGGACRTKSFAGLRYDMGAHRLHNVYPEVTAEIRRLLGADLVAVNVPSHIYHRGRVISFPPGPFALVRALGFWRTATSMVRALASPSRVADNFRDHAIAKYGRSVAESFLVNYSEKLWGVPAERLSVQVSGSRLQGLDARSALRDFLGLRHGEHLDGAFLYPRGGFGQITDALAAGLPHVHTGAKVQRVLHADGRITAIVLADGREVLPQTVVSSLPLPALIRMLDPPPPQSILDLAASLRLRSVRLAILVVEVASVSGSASLYFPGADVPFTRLYEPKHRRSALAPAHRTCVVLEHPVFPGDTVDGLSREDFLAMSRKALLSTGLLAEGALLDGTDQMVQDAYPVLDVSASTRVSAVDDYLECFTNLHRIGRASCFRYSHFHGLMRDGRLLAERIARDSSHVPPSPPPYSPAKGNPS